MLHLAFVDPAIPARACEESLDPVSKSPSVTEADLAKGRQHSFLHFHLATSCLRKSWYTRPNAPKLHAPTDSVELCDV